MKAVLFKLKLWLNSLLMYLVCYFTKDIKFLKISIFKTLLISDLLFDNSEHKIYHKHGSSFASVIEREIKSQYHMKSI